MIEANFDWMDVGTWNAVLELSKREDIKPVQHKVTRHFSGNTSRIIDSLTVLNSSLISFINKAKNMKVVKREIRPWGFFSIILTSDNFLIKRLVINPLSCTSKQFHHHRDECHIILSGSGYITLNEKVHAVAPNHVIEIPRNVSHRIENRNTDLPLEIIEFQMGEYLSDDDIVRLNDVYGRTA